MLRLLRSRALKKRNVEGFGTRLTELRKQAGLTQVELGDKVGVSNRVIAYYEQDEAQPPGAMLASLADALGVTTDELLGLKPAKARKNGTPPRPGRRSKLEEQFQAVRRLPRGDQQFVSKLLDQLLTGKT